MTDKTRRMRTAEASTYLDETWGVRRTPDTLKKLRCVGGGPRFEVDGRFPLYTKPFLDEYAREQLSPPVRSNAELHKIRREAYTPDP